MQSVAQQQGPGAANGPRRSFTLGEVPLAPPRKRNKKRKIQTSGSASEEMPNVPEEESVSDSAPANAGARERTYSTRASLNESIQNQITEDLSAGAMEDLFTKGSVNCVVLGTSNCHELPLRGDDAVELNVDLVVQGGLKIHEASHKLSSDIPPVQLLEKTAAILHLGAPDFPVEGNTEIDRLYASYVDLAADVSISCPNARIFISSIPPRKGSLKLKINRDIRRMNTSLSQLADNDERITFVNNDRFLTDGEETLSALYDDRESDDIHLNLQGKVQLANYLFDFIKNDFYKARLDSRLEAQK